MTKQLVLERAVPAVLDGIWGTTVAKHMGDVGPLVSNKMVKMDDFIVLFGSPCFFTHIRCKMVKVSFAALLPDSAFDMFGNQ